MATSSRTVTPEGMIRAGAVLTRSGPFKYTRGELGLTGAQDEVVTVNRTMDSLVHPETLESLRGAPITLDHPPDGVRPDNWSGTVVGHVVGEPRVMGSAVVADVMIGDETALEALDDGKRELSIGYEFLLDESGMRTNGPLACNHVALVDRGRAGTGVRVLDNAHNPRTRLDTMTPDQGGPPMDDAAITKAVDSALEAAVERLVSASDRKTAGDEATIRAVVDEAFADTRKTISEMVETARKVTDAQTEARTAAEDAARKERAEAAAKKLEDTIRSEERQRHKILTDAAPLLDDAQRAELGDADPHAILVAALGDSVTDAKDRSVDYLLGALEMAATRSTDSGSDGLPHGVSTFDAGMRRDPMSARDKAMREYMDAFDEAYAKAGGI